MQSVETARAGRPPARLEGKQDEIEKLAGFGHTQAEIAEFFDCDKRTVQRYLAADNPDASYREAWLRGRAKIVRSLRMLQIKHAQGAGASAVAMTIHMSKHQLGESDKSLNQHVHMNPDGSPIDGAEKPKRFVVILPDNGRDPIPAAKPPPPVRDADFEDVDF